ncbi:outer membrane receptor for ferrienterochelin and colicins [Beggiatoa alba B18LD]|uniref:Outer membrane receptor for ferrienterochelin and colicins n=1 Tax=Beggiatoa alba B18LD TaxID=395493 RepID=I3CF54_9GAMM|nr:TonB-dependent receptor [Beggiatoa alba]EIJ42247.1 outer membrane receptor for ferrienterochelin and colicins [Beggiatoa alba B18LD]
MGSLIKRIYLLLLIGVITSSLLGVQAVHATEEDATAVKYMSLEELMDVEIVSIATGTSQAQTKAPATTTVITSDEIKALGAQSLDEVLATVPGVQVSRNYFAYFSNYSVRGVRSSPYNPHVLVLRNGMPVSSLYSGGRLLLEGTTSLRDIERIEIIRGPGSAVYGADAFSAVINLITKTAKDIDGTEVGVRIGSFDTQETWLLQGSDWNGIDTMVSLQYQTTDGDKSLISEDLYTTIDRMYGTQTSLAPNSVSRSERGLDMSLGLSTTQWQWHAGAKIRRNLGNGVGLLQSVDPEGRYQSDQVYTDFIYHLPIDAQDWAVNVQGSYHMQRWNLEKMLLVAPVGAFGEYYEGTHANIGTSEMQSRLNVEAFYKGWEKHLLRFGFGYLYGNLYDITDIRTEYPLPPAQAYLLDRSDSEDGFLETGYRQNWHAFLQDVYNFAPDWELTTGLRYDYYSDFGSTINPRIALVWQTHPVLTSKLLYGRAFRAPSFFELYGRNNPVSFGNRKLKAETIQSWELGFNYHPLTTFQTDLNFFYYQFEDGVGYVPVIPPPENYPQAFAAINATTQTGHGVEWQVKWQALNNLLLSGYYAYQDSQQSDATSDEGNVPHPNHAIYARATWLFAPRWQLTTQVQWVGARQRVKADTRSALDDYVLTHLTLNYQPSNAAWGLTAGIHNVFDEYATEPSLGVNADGILPLYNDLPLEGRNYFLEVRYKF